MFHKPVKLTLLLSSAFIWSTQALAQVTNRPFENVPYSRYGLGEEMNAINPALKAMGSTTAAFADPYIINTENPASYATLKHMTYEAGLEGRRRTLLTNSGNYQTGTAAISYLNIGIPLGKNGGMVIGYRPLSKVSYALSDTGQSLIGPTTRNYDGNGGTNYFFMGGAGKYKGLSIGANVGYVFGTINQSSWYKTNSTSFFVNNSEFLRRSNIGGLYIKTGVQYEYFLPKDFKLSVGVQANFRQNIRTELSEYWISHPFYAPDTTGSDTSYAVKGVKANITLPTEINSGIQLSKSDKWLIGVSYRTTNWSQFAYHNIIDSIGNRTYRMSIGGEFTPNSLSLYNYWKRVTYRAGFYFGKDNIQINQQQSNYFAATFGLSLPFKRSTDRIHTTAEIGKIGNLSTNGLQQNFFRFTFGVSFNDKSWFVKRKYD